MALKILLTGGGTGGHITPLLAVAHELKSISPNCSIIYIGERNGKYATMLEGNSDIDEVYEIFAGKFRRYNGESWLRRLIDVETLLLNVRDLLYFIIGTLQSVYLVKKINAEVTFLKGGFVGAPVGLGCALWRKSFITHDSDSMPGLANRIVSRWATLHATAMPPEYYTYPRDQVKHVGVLVGADYSLVDEKSKRAFRNELSIPKQADVLMVTGGSGGSAIINKAIAQSARQELNHNPNLYIIHQVGQGKAGIYGDYNNPRLQVHELLKDMYRYSAAADVIVTRAGANTLAEFGVQGKPCVVVPNPLLTGGHQLLNAEHLASNNAAIIFDEAKIENTKGNNPLWDTVNRLLSDEKHAHEISTNLHKLTKKNATIDIAKLLLSMSESKQ